MAVYDYGRVVCQQRRYAEGCGGVTGENNCGLIGYVDELFLAEEGDV